MMLIGVFSNAIEMHAELEEGGLQTHPFSGNCSEAPLQEIIRNCYVHFMDEILKP